MNLDDEIESAGLNNHAEIIEKLGIECGEVLKAVAESYNASVAKLLTEAFHGWNETFVKAQDALTSAIDAMKPSLDALQSIAKKKKKKFTKMAI